MHDPCDSVDVRHFGAKGDGLTDDSAAFQAAVDYLNGKANPEAIRAESPGD